MYEHSKVVLLLCGLSNKDLHTDAFLNTTWLSHIVIVFQKKMKVDKTIDQFWIKTIISLESCSFPRAMSHEANELMNH